MVHLQRLSNYLDAYLRVWLLYALVYLRNSFVTSAIDGIVAFIHSDDEFLGRRLEFTHSCVSFWDQYTSVARSWLRPGTQGGCEVCHTLRCVSPTVGSPIIHRSTRLYHRGWLVRLTSR